MKKQAPLQIILPWLLIVVLSSAVAMVFGISRDDNFIAMTSAAGFSIFILAMGLATNLPYWRRAKKSAASKTVESAPAKSLDNEVVDIARRNAKLFATSYVWGGTSLLAIYSLTQLSWQHGWQYAVGMFLLSAISVAFAVALARPAGETRTRLLRLASILTTVQGVAALAGLVFLVTSGKLSSTRADWAANYVFLFGGIAIVALSAIALRSDRILRC